MDIAPARMLQRGLIEVYCRVSCCHASEGLGFTSEHQNMPEMHLIVNIVTSHDTGCDIVTRDIIYWH